jgi:nucleotidyltransferase/DNA polymerase involved in DNA repair
MSSRNPQLLQVAGDLIMKAADFPMAEQLAERLEKTLPPNLQDKKEGEEEIPAQAQAQIAEMQQQLQQLGEALQNAAGEVEKLETEKDGKDSELEIKRIEANTKAYQAITQRLQVLGPLLNPNEVQSLATETQREAMEQPDPGRPPSESMGIPEPDQIQAPSGAFFTPEQ